MGMVVLYLGETVSNLFYRMYLVKPKNTPNFFWKSANVWKIIIKMGRQDTKKLNTRYRCLTFILKNKKGCIKTVQLFNTLE